MISATTICKMSFTLPDMPMPRRGPRMPSQSSTAPIIANPHIQASGTKMDIPKTRDPNKVTALRMRVSMVTGKRNMNPPMVGVCILTRCELGRSSMRIILPTFQCLSKRIKGSPQIMVNKKAIPLTAMAIVVFSISGLPPGQRRSTQGAYCVNF